MAKKALLIGINRYKIPGADLRGCVNDVKNLRSVLTQFYGFAGKDIKVVTDFLATKKTMQSEIGKLIKGAKPGHCNCSRRAATIRCRSSKAAKRIWTAFSWHRWGRVWD